MELPENTQMSHVNEKGKKPTHEARSTEDITKVIPSPVDSANTLVKLHNEAQAKIWLKDIIPPYRQPGGAISAGDCFFHSIADCLNQRSGKEEYSIQSLRIFCDEYVKDLKNSWVKDENTKDREDHNNYLVRIRFTAQELLEKERAGQKLGLATWGRPKVEGRMFCEQYNIRIHVIQIQEDGAIHGYLIDRNGETDDYNPVIDYQDINILHIINYHNHFVPLLNSNLYISDAQRALLTRFNNSKGNLSTKSNYTQPIKATSIATEDMYAEQVSIRRIQANVYTNSADAFNRASPTLSASVISAHISPALPAVLPLLSTVTADIKSLSTEEITASLVIDEEAASSEAISQQNAKPTVVQQHIQINAGIAVLIPPKIEVKVAALRAQLKNYYQQYDNKIKRLFGVSLDLDKGFVNLSIVQHDEQKQAEKDRLRSYLDRTKFYSSYEDIYSTKEKEIISPQDLFKERNNKIPKRIAVIGRAGIGKSILSQYLCAYLWAANGCWQEIFDVVIKIQLRNLTKERYDKNPSLADIINIDCTDSSGITIKLGKDEIEATLQSIPNRALVILDGWDEFNLKTSPCAKLILDLMKNPTLSIIVTSRPYTNLNEKDFDLLLECIGFTTENIPEYIYRVCDDKIQVPLIIAFLNRNPAIHSLAHIPIILDMIIGIWDDEMHARIEPMTMTELYSKMITKLWKVYIEKQQELYPGIDDEKLCQKKEQAKAFLSLLAFKAIQNNTILISYQLVEKVIKDTYRCDDEDVEQKLKAALAGGFINTCDSKNFRGDYYFPHLTIQEYMAARHWVKLFISNNNTERDQAILLLIDNKFNPRFEIIWWFVAGILIELNNNVAVQLFFDIVIEKNNDIISYYEKLLLMRCLEEAKIPICLKQRPMLLATFKSLINAWIKKFNLPNLMGCPNPILNIKTYLQLCPKIVSEAGICDDLINGLFAQQHITNKIVIGDSLYELADNQAMIRYVPKLIDYISQEEDDVYYIVKIFSKFIEEGFFQIYDESIEIAKTNDNFKIRKALLQAICRTSITFRKKHEERFFSYIIDAMNQDGDELINVVIAESTELKKSNIEPIIDHFHALLSYQNPQIRCCAIKGLLQIISDTNKKVLILKNGIDDVYKIVREYAIDMLLSLKIEFPALVLPVFTDLLKCERLEIEFKLKLLQSMSYPNLDDLELVINSLLDALIQFNNEILIKKILNVINTLLHFSIEGEPHRECKIQIILKTFVKKIQLYDEASREKLQQWYDIDALESQNDLHILEENISKQKNALSADVTSDVINKNTILNIFSKIGRAQGSYHNSKELIKKFQFELEELHQLSGLDKNILFTLAGLVSGGFLHKKTQEASWRLAQLIQSGKKITILDILVYMPDFLLGLDAGSMGIKPTTLFLISLANNYPNQIVPLLIKACAHQNNYVKQHIYQVLRKIQLAPYLPAIERTGDEKTCILFLTLDSMTIDSLVEDYINEKFNNQILFKVLVYKFMNISTAVYFDDNDLCFFENGILKRITFHKNLINDFILKIQSEMQEITGIRPGLIGSSTVSSNIFVAELPISKEINIKHDPELPLINHAQQSAHESCLLS